ncbi:hypothetical protein Tco_0680320 [Tanacetum coccineum]|uniref:Uncharacterized protein n=1 Tax=Tanacetum coccineum TaxID=301880 RepID=A0ABQ4XL39_9ASTR
MRGGQSNETEELNLDVDTEVIAKDKGSGEKGGSIVSTARPKVDTVRPDIDTARLEVHTTNALVNTAGVTISTADPKVSAVEPRTPPTTTSIFDDEDITMAQTLIKMKEEKAKEKGVAFKDVEDSSRHVRSITTLKLLPSIESNDKGKGIDADALFAAKLQQEEREEYIIEERANFLAETINMGGYKHSQLKTKSFEDIQGMYERQKKIVDNFKPMDSDDAIKDSKKAADDDTSKKEEVLQEPESTKVEVKQEGQEENIRKRSGRRLKMKATKKSKR